MNETIMADLRYALGQIRMSTDRMQRAIDALERIESALQEAGGMTDAEATVGQQVQAWTAEEILRNEG